MTDLIYSAGFFGWLGEQVINGIASFFYSILLWLNAIIYSFISYIYNIFLILAGGGSIFDDKQIGDMVSRIYVIIGVVVLFLVAYSLLKSMVNPDEAFKGKKSPVNVIKDVLISIVLISIIPYVFDFAFEFQNSILINNTIGKIIAGSATGGNEETIRMGGYNMAAGVWKAFIHVEDGYCETEAEEANKVKEVTGESCEIVYLSDGSTSYAQMWKNAKDKTTFWELVGLAGPILNDQVSYLFFFDIVTGIFVLFVMISYCLDMALRLVKLAVYELIAPLPILARIIPHEQAGKIFTNWVKATLSTFAEVFIRIAILYFAVIIIATVGSSLDNLFINGAFAAGNALPLTKLIAQALIIVGIVMFVKQAPEIIKEITGLDGSKYNVLKSAKQGFSLLAGGIAGGSAFAGLRAWEGAGQAKNLMDFSSIGNQYKRKIAKQEAKEQGASWKDRAGDSMRKRFGFETKLEQANRNLERGLSMDGHVQKFTNDTDGDIVLYKDDGSILTTIAKGSSVDLTDEIINALQHKKDLNAQELSKIDERIRHIKEGKDVDQKYIDWRGKIKKKALEKINEGHNHIKEDLTYSYTDSSGVVHNENKGQMNYAAMLAYKQSRINDGASAEEISALEDAIMKNEDKMWVEYANWAIAADQGGEIHTWFNQAKNFHDDVGIYDADSKRMVQYKASDLQTQMDKVVGSYVDKATGATRDLKDNMALFESAKIEIVDKETGGAVTYTDSSGVTQTKATARGFDKYSKAMANGSDTQIQHIEVEKVQYDDETKRIDRLNKQLEERKTEFKSSSQYQAYKASDNANKISDSGKSGS